jgi:mRNA interferase HigB
LKSGTIKLYLQAKPPDMNIVSHRKLVEFYRKHPQSKTALEQWYHQTKNANQKCFTDITKDFNSTDGIGNQRYVFNIKGNDFRLVVVIQFTHGYVYIRFVGTHAEYDKINAKLV